MEKRKIVPVLVLTLATAVGCVTAGTLSTEARAESLQAASRLETSCDGLERSVERGDALLRSTMKDDVADEATLTDLDMALCQAHVVLDEGVRDSGGTSIFDWASMSADAQHNRQTADEAAFASAALVTAMQDVRASIALEQSIEAQDALSAQLDDARSVRDQNDGKVSDVSTMTTLEDAIASAEQTVSLDVNVTDANVYREATDALSSASDSVKTSHDEWQKAQEAAAAAARRASAARYASRSEAQAAAQSGGTVAQASDGTWYVSYATGQYVDSSGGVTEYFDNYYVAHRSTGTNGQTIASRPTYVVVDGVRYQYVSERHAAVGSDYNLIKDWATANGGIAFQTCEPDGSVLVTHYEPVG